MARRPVRSFVVLSGVAVLAMVIGVVIGRGIRSPAQQALDTNPPEKSVITAVVTMSQSEGKVVSRGTVSAGQTVSIGPVQAYTADSVITSVPVAAGDVVKVGSRLIEVSGRPIFLLQGNFPAYRDLHAGDSGPDVAQLNKALAQLGLGAPESNAFTTATSSALASYYRQSGYQPPPGGGMDRREVAFVSGSTATVAAVTARVGASANAADLVTLTSGTTSVTANLDPTSAAVVHVGDKAAVYPDDAAAPLDATVTDVKIGDTLKTTTVTLSPTSAIPGDKSGTDVRVEFSVRSTDSSSLRVPVSAVYSTSDGRTVVVVAKDANRRVVAVQVGQNVGGFVGITPTDDVNAVVVGDQVIVSGPGYN